MYTRSSFIKMNNHYSKTLKKSQVIIFDLIKPHFPRPFTKHKSGRDAHLSRFHTLLFFALEETRDPAEKTSSIVFSRDIGLQFQHLALKR